MICPICNTESVAFREFGRPPRPGAMCPRCGSLERHRLVGLYVRQIIDGRDTSRMSMLHIAPEDCLRGKWGALFGAGYITGDAQPGKADDTIDITAIDYPDERFDIVVCNHVFEHLPAPTDSNAMRELLRVTKRGGSAIITVPVPENRTVEDRPNQTPQQRQSSYGQEDHYRRCGPDYADRIRAAGWRVKAFTARDICLSHMIAMYGLNHEIAWHCERDNGGTT